MEMRRFIACLTFSLSLLVTVFLSVRIAEAQSEILADGWQVADIGFGIKPAFDFESDGRFHVMGITEEFVHGVIWHAVADSLDGPWDPQTASEGYFYGPGDLRVDATGTVHMAWHNHDDQDPNHVTVDPEGNATLYRIPTPGHNGWDNSLAFDSSGNVHQSSVDPILTGGLISLEYGVFDGSSWSYEKVPNSDFFIPDPPR